MSSSIYTVDSVRAALLSELDVRSAPIEHHVLSPLHMHNVTYGMIDLVFDAMTNIVREDLTKLRSLTKDAVEIENKTYHLSARVLTRYVRDIVNNTCDAIKEQTERTQMRADFRKQQRENAFSFENAVY